MSNKKPTQCERIKDYMNEYGSITPLEAMRDLGVMRLASRISEMKDAGMLIGSSMEHGKNRRGETTHYKKYFFLEVEEEQK